MATAEIIDRPPHRDMKQLDRIAMAREGLTTRRAMAPFAGATALDNQVAGVMEVMSADDEPNQIDAGALDNRLSLAITHMRQTRDKLVNGHNFRLL